MPKIFTDGDPSAGIVGFSAVVLRPHSDVPDHMAVVPKLTFHIPRHVEHHPGARVLARRDPHYCDRVGAQVSISLLIYLFYSAPASHDFYSCKIAKKIFRIHSQIFE